MINCLKRAIIAVVVLLNFIPSSIVIAKEQSYQSSFLADHAQDLNKLKPEERQFIKALTSSDRKAVKNMATQQNVNKVFQAHLAGPLDFGPAKGNMQATVDIPYLWIATEAYMQAPDKQAKHNAFLILKELLTLGANPNNARIIKSVLSGKNKGSQAKGAAINAVIPTIFLSVAIEEDPVLLELFLQHKGNLNVRAFSSSYTSGKEKPSYSTTLLQELKRSKNQNIKALVKKYAQVK